ncbi:MAG: hypothetical protein IID31_10645 [Planctomycetes bacterium]|nr:hypothetical protein [Planctomycetota bacterium]
MILIQRGVRKDAPFISITCDSPVRLTRLRLTPDPLLLRYDLIVSILTGPGFPFVFIPLLI